MSGDTVEDEKDRLDEAMPPSTQLVIYQPGSNDCGKRHRSSESDYRDGIDAALDFGTDQRENGIDALGREALGDGDDVLDPVIDDLVGA